MLYISFLLHPFKINEFPSRYFFEDCALLVNIILIVRYFFTKTAIFFSIKDKNTIKIKLFIIKTMADRNENAGMNPDEPMNDTNSEDELLVC